MTQWSLRAVVTAAALAFYPWPSIASQQRTVYEELQTFSDVLTYARLNHVDSVGIGGFVRAAIDGALRSLDPHSYFLSREDWEQFTAWQEGRWVTTGVFLEYEDGAIAVAAVVPGSPAAKAGLVLGDRLLSINDSSVIGVPVQRLQARLAGERGTKVRLTLERGSRLEADTLSVTLKRSAVAVGSAVMARMIDSVTGYVRLRDFKLGAGREFHETLDKLAGDGARQLLVDLRGNPGGAMDAAVEVAAEVLPKSTLVFATHGRKVDTNRDYRTERDGQFTGLPLIILIDHGTVSAAEALAACLQDHDRALVIGRRSFGKALEQVSFPVRSGGVVMLTVARIVSPSGRVIQRPYAGLGFEQYVALAGKGGDGTDTTAFRTDHGRLVRGGGGVAPDVSIAPGPAMPAWWSVAVDSGWADAVADSVARSLQERQPTGWMRAADRWRERLVPPLIARVESSLRVPTRPDSALEGHIAWLLATRVAEVKWGSEVRERLILANDPDIRAAVTYFPRLAELLTGTK